jgi:hypothetical protein
MMRVVEAVVIWKGFLAGFASKRARASDEATKAGELRELNEEFPSSNSIAERVENLVLELRVQ